MSFFGNKKQISDGACENFPEANSEPPPAIRPQDRLRTYDCAPPEPFSTKG